MHQNNSVTWKIDLNPTELQTLALALMERIRVLEQRMTAADAHPHLAQWTGADLQRDNPANALELKSTRAILARVQTFLKSS